MSRRFIPVLVLLGLVAVARIGAAESGFRVSKPDLRRQVIAVIEEQLRAFRDGDVAKAYGQAAAIMRAQNSARRFAAIVRENYPEIWANTGAEYGVVRDDGTHATVLVHVSSASGSGAYDYVLLKEQNGWRIGSVIHYEPRRKNSV